MMVILFDDSSRDTLLPLTFIRPVSEIRLGILTITEKWQKAFNSEISFLTQDYLRNKFPLNISADNIYINGSVCPDEQLVDAISALKDGEKLEQDGLLIAVKLNGTNADGFQLDRLSEYKPIEFSSKLIRIIHPEDIFRLNDIEIRKDFKLLTQGRTSFKISESNTILGDDFFAEEGVEAECSTFNTKLGPIYIGKNSQVWEGSHIRGSFALCHDSQVKMGARIYGMTTIGPNCRVGGEINNSVMFGYSSKGHDGYLGNSVIGEWCNLGADSNNSNLKNNYANVKLWDYSLDELRDTGLQFCGLIMGDHSKCAINTMFNTGTVVGVSTNVFGADFPKNFVPDFSWGGVNGMETYRLDKMFHTAGEVFRRKEKVFNEIEKDILKSIFNNTKKYR